MKSRLTLLILCMMLGLVVFLTRKASAPGTSPLSVSVAPTPNPPLQKDMASNALDKMSLIQVSDVTYRYAVYEAKKEDTLKLYPNFTSRSSANDVFEQRSCQFLTNGSYYTEDGNPLGWFVSEKEEIRNEIESRLMDGFIFLPVDETEVHLSYQKPDYDVEWGLQAGPMLIFDNSVLPLTIKNDEAARRMVAVITNDRKLIFLAITGRDFITNGPKLADLPGVVSKISQELGVQAQAAINLDGGSASAFITDELAITEYSWIGSYFCITGQ